MADQIPVSVMQEAVRLVDELKAGEGMVGFVNLLARAILEERQACAQVARNQPILSTGREGMVGQLGMQGRIVEAIRKGTEG